MRSLNLVLIEGRLVRDAEVKYSASGKAYTNISIAVPVRNGKEEVANFFNVLSFDKLELTKGQLVRVSGALRQDVWEKDGQKHSKVKIIAEDVDYVKSKTDRLEKTNVWQNNEFRNDIPF